MRMIGMESKKIVQIAALKVSNDLEIIDPFNVLCQPVVNPVLSDYFGGIEILQKRCFNTVTKRYLRYTMNTKNKILLL